MCCSILVTLKEDKQKPVWGCFSVTSPYPLSGPLQLSPCVTSGSFLHSSGPQFPQVETRNDSTSGRLIELVSGTQDSPGELSRSSSFSSQMRKLRLGAMKGLAWSCIVWEGQSWAWEARLLPASGTPLPQLCMVRRRVWGGGHNAQRRSGGGSLPRLQFWAVSEARRLAWLSPHSSLIFPKSICCVSSSCSRESGALCTLLHSSGLFPDSAF